MKKLQNCKIAGFSKNFEKNDKMQNPVKFQNLQIKLSQRNQKIQYKLTL